MRHVFIVIHTYLIIYVLLYDYGSGFLLSISLLVMYKVDILSDSDYCL